MVKKNRPDILKQDRDYALYYLEGAGLRLCAPLADMRLEPVVGIQNFLLMMRTAFIQNDVANHDQKLLALSSESAGERMLARYINQPFTNPLPELFLGGPELIIIGAHDSRGLLCTSFGRR